MAKERISLRETSHSPGARSVGKFLCPRGKPSPKTGTGRVEEERTLLSLGANI